MSLVLIAGIAFAIFFLFFVVMVRGKSSPADQDDAVIYECHFCDDQDCDCTRSDASDSE